MDRKPHKEQTKTRYVTIGTQVNFKGWSKGVGEVWRRQGGMLYSTPLQKYPWYFHPHKASMRYSCLEPSKQPNHFQLAL